MYVCMYVCTIIARGVTSLFLALNRALYQQRPDLNLKLGVSSA
jgi:hypothetical protein